MVKGRRLNGKYVSNGQLEYLENLVFCQSLNLLLTREGHKRKSEVHNGLSARSFFILMDSQARQAFLYKFLCTYIEIFYRPPFQLIR